MGLPLYVAPVESDVPPKTSKSHSAAADARSSIRRANRYSPNRRQAHETRDHRLRLLASLSRDAEQPLITAPRPPSNNSRTPTPPADPWLDSPWGDIRPADYATGALHPLGIPNSLGRARPLSSIVGFHHNGEQRRSHSIRGNLAPERPTNSIRVSATPASDNPDDSGPPSHIYLAFTRRNRQRQQESESLLHPSSAALPPGRRSRHVDGLGDRDRSLSPENDTVWDTLQSTLTPDPQPPSVAGSSFASTNASAGPSQPSSTVRNSANTSSTSLGTLAEPPCDPVALADPEFRNTIRRLDEIYDSNLTARSSRTYADAVAVADDEDESDRFEYLSGMHRIIRALVLRQDIPDEWWAEAGLSRSFDFGSSSE